MCTGERAGKKSNTVSSSWSLQASGEGYRYYSSLYKSLINCHRGYYTGEVESARGVRYKGWCWESQQEKERADEEETGRTPEAAPGPSGCHDAQLRLGPPRDWTGETGGQERASPLSRK